MNLTKKLRWISALMLLGLLVTSGSLFAQITYGNVYGKVTDEQGAALPGATATLTGIGAPRVQVSDAEGQFRFLGLPPGSYTVKVELEGFNSYEIPVTSNANRNVTLEVTLSAAVQETITVTGANPLLDERKTVTGATISQAELNEVPNARDPWSLLTQTPGVLNDRINVGGNESGQQAVFVSIGASSDDVSWQVDGVNITDMQSISSPSYFDFNAFEEVQFTTGGSDVSLESSGVTVNIVTKRGSNGWRGAGRFIRTDGDWQSDPSISKGDAGTNLAGVKQNLNTYTPNSINLIDEYGVDLGGALWKDHMWGWAAYGKSEIDNIVGGGQHDITELENYNYKFNWQIAASNSFTGQYSTNDKIKNGRGAGADRAPETTTDQSGEHGAPSDIIKFEDTHIFNSNFYLTGMYSFVDGGFALEPKGGHDQAVYVGADGVYRGSYYYLSNSRDVEQYRVDGSAFFNTGNVSHELKFGGSQRTQDVFSYFGYGGRQIAYNCDFYGCEDPSQTALLLFRDSYGSDSTDFNAYWLQDTLTFGNFTINAGLRYEEASGTILPAQIDGIEIAGKQFMPGLSSQGFDPGINDFNILMPRVGLTYALGPERKTLLRASFSRFAEQYLTGNHLRLSSTGSNAYILFAYFTDLNGNGFMDTPAEVATYVDGIPRNFNPADPNADRTPNATDSGLKPNHVDELTFSVEHALRSDFVISATALYRKVSDITETETFVSQNGGAKRIIQPGDYVQKSCATPVGNVECWSRISGVRNFGGSYLTNGNREQDALGLTLAFNKRLSNRWMARGNFTYTDWTWSVPNSYFNHVDPNNFGDGAGTTASGDRDGEVVAERSGGSGSKGGVWLNTKWAGNISGLYQVAPDRPWGFNIGAALNFRQGYPNPPYISVGGGTIGDGSTRSLQFLPDIDSRRNDNVYTLDLRFDKNWDFGPVDATFGIDVFNVFNNNTVLQRQRSATSSSYTYITETISPRVLRLGLTLGFK